MSSAKCVICNRNCNLFNYGAQCCNACKMFFRRVIHFKTPLHPCEINETCYESPNPNSECRLCRFQQCITAGMIRNIEKFDLSNVFPPLLQLEKRKRYIIENCQLPSRAFTFEEAANEKTIDFVMKSPDIIFDSFGWEAMTQIATTDYLKKLSFSKMMTSADLKAFLKSSYLDCILLSTAMHYYSLNCEKIYFPGGIDVFPKEMELVLNFKPELDSRIKSRLIGRLAELKITNEEFLLLNMIFICNPSVLHISKTGGLLLANFQQIYSDLLLKYCQMTYQQHAPTRFTDLLSLCHVMALTKKDICNAILLLQFYEPGVEGKVIIKSAVRHMLKH